MRQTIVIVALCAGELIAAAQPAPTPPAGPTEEPAPPPGAGMPVPDPAPPPPAPVAIEPPPPEPMPVVVAGTYPAELPLRPLALPGGQIEIAARGDLLDAPFLDQDPIEGFGGVRVGLGTAEIEGGVGMHLRDFGGATAPDRLAVIMLGGRFVIDPDFTAGVEARIFQPTMDDPPFQINGMIGKKLRLSDIAAVEGRGGGSFTRFPGMTSASLVALVTQGRLQVAPTPQVSVEGIVNGNFYLGGDAAYSYTAFDYAMRVLFTPTRQLDVFLGFAIVPSSPDISYKTITLGVQGRVR